MKIPDVMCSKTLKLVQNTNNHGSRQLYRGRYFFGHFEGRPQSIEWLAVQLRSANHKNQQNQKYDLRAFLLPYTTCQLFFLGYFRLYLGYVLLDLMMSKLKLCGQPLILPCYKKNTVLRIIDFILKQYICLVLFYIFRTHNLRVFFSGIH